MGCVPSSPSCLPSVVTGQSFLNLLPSSGSFARAVRTSQMPHSQSFHGTRQAREEESLSLPTAGREPSSTLLRNSELSLKPPSDAV